jgi:glycerophosphoryl diester phosphodiesterase
MHPYFDVPRPHLFGHRGAAGEAPENTLPSFEKAWAAGVLFLETDCHATRDGEIVLCHDSVLDRTTNGQGLISAHDYTEIEKLDAGYHFTTDGGDHPFRGRRVRVPRLVELLDAFPDARINLDIKDAASAVVEQVVQLVRRAQAERRVLLTSEEGHVLDHLLELAPGTALGSSRDDALAFFSAFDSGTLDNFTPRGQALQIPASAFGRDLVTPEVIAAAERAGLFVHVWTIDDPTEMQRLLAIGAHGLISDYPARLVAVARAASVHTIP